MKSRMLFRPSGRAIPTRGMSEWWWGVLAALVLVVVLGASKHADLASDERVLAAGAARDAEIAAQTEQRVREELLPTVGAAYEQGQRDAMEAVRGTREGLALAQACLAMKGVR